MYFNSLMFRAASTRKEEWEYMPAVPIMTWESTGNIFCGPRTCNLGIGLLFIVNKIIPSEQRMPITGAPFSTSVAIASSTEQVPLALKKGRDVWPQYDKNRQWIKIRPRNKKDCILLFLAFTGCFCFLFHLFSCKRVRNLVPIYGPGILGFSIGVFDDCFGDMQL